MVKRFAISGAIVALLALVAVGAACVNGILGIDSASVDQSLGPCSTYCNTVVKNCPNSEYNDVPTCQSLCPAFEPGTANDTNQDSLGCRMHYAQLAATDPSKCPAAGLLGGNVCGNDQCRTFCALDDFFCTGPLEPYDGGAVACTNTCRANFQVYLQDAGNDLALQTGNTLNCRVYHLEAAAAPNDPSAKGVHCPHTGLISTYCQ